MQFERAIAHIGERKKEWKKKNKNKKQVNRKKLFAAVGIWTHGLYLQSHAQDHGALQGTVVEYLNPVRSQVSLRPGKFL